MLRRVGVGVGDLCSFCETCNAALMERRGPSQLRRFWWLEAAVDGLRRAAGKAGRKARETRRENYYRSAYRRYRTARRNYEREQESMMHSANRDLQHQVDAFHDW